MGALAASVTHTAEVRFAPVLSFGLYHEGNTEIVGDPTDGGDDVGHVAADLVVTRTTPTSELSFAYRPSYTAYRVDTDLNYFAQSASFGYTNSTSRSSTYTFSASGYRTDRQGVQPSDPAEPVTFVVRNTTTHGGGSIHGTHRGRRNLLDWEVRAGLDDYDIVQDIAQGAPQACLSDLECDDANSCTTDTCELGFCAYELIEGCELQNSQHGGAAASWRYELSQNSNIGLGVRFDVIFYEDLPDVTVESLGIVGSHTFSRVTSMSYTAGVSVTSSEGESAPNFAGNVTLSRTITEVSSLSAGISQSVSHGSGIGSVSLDSGVYVGYTHSAPRPGLTGSVTAGYWRREPVDVSIGTPTTTTLSAVGSIGWIFNRYLSLNITDAYSYQTSSDTNLETQYNTYGVNVRWVIFGRRES